MNRLFRRLSLLLCVLLLLITALSGCGTSPAAPSGPSTPQAPTAEDEALRRGAFQPVITCELAGETETLTEEQQQAILSYTTMLCTALARPDDPLPEEPYTTDTLRQEALTRGFLWSSYIWGEQRVQVYPMNPIYRSEDAVEVWASLRVEANYSSDLTQTTGDTFGYGSLHHLTLNRTAQGWQVVGDDYEESDLCGYLSGCGTASLPSEDILAAIQNYLDLRAAVMAGRTPAAPDRCTAPLREDAQALAEARRGRVRRHLRCTVPPRLLYPHAAERRDGAGDLSGDPTGGSPAAGRHRRHTDLRGSYPDPPAADGRLVAGLRRQL